MRAIATLSLFSAVILQTVNNTAIFDRQRSTDAVAQLIVSFDFMSVCMYVRMNSSRCCVAGIF